MTLLLCLIGLVTGLLLRLGTEVRGRCEGVNSFPARRFLGRCPKCRAGTVSIFVCKALKARFAADQTQTL